MRFRIILTVTILTFIGTLTVLNFKLASYALTSHFSGAAEVETVLPTAAPVSQAYLLPITLTSSPTVTENPLVSPVRNSTPSTAPKVRPTQTSSPLAVSYTIEIPSLGVSAPIVFQPAVTEAQIYKSLKGGVVHYASTPKPGEYGASIMLGHSSSPPWSPGKYDTVFAGLDRLKVGDKIIVRRGAETLQFAVTTSLTFSPKNPNEYELKELEATPTSSVILMSCWPVGTNYRRIAVRADILES